MKWWEGTPGTLIALGPGNVTIYKIIWANYKVLYSTNLPAKLLSDSLLLDSIYISYFCRVIETRLEVGRTRNAFSSSPKLSRVFL